MFFNFKIYLSNCDSVKKLDRNFLEEKILQGLCFSNDGIILSPNILLDNNVDFLINNKILNRYLNEEGYGKFIIRGINFKEIGSFKNYFNDFLPNSFKVSMFNGKEKSNLTKKEIEIINLKLKRLDFFLKNNQIILQNAVIKQNSLTMEIHKRLQNTNFFNSDYKLEQFLNKSKNLISRSQWYKFVDEYLENIDQKNKFIFNYINPSYYYLYTDNKEGFIQERGKIDKFKLNKYILYSILLKKTFEDEKKLIDIGLNIFKFIISLGKINIVEYITDQAKELIKDKIKDLIIENDWFGIYNNFIKTIGIEVKNETNNIQK